MKLPNISDLIGKKDSGDEILVSFIIGKNWIQAGLWKIVDNRCEILAAGSTDSWHNTESFVGAADDSLSSAIGSTEEPPEEIKNVVFGLPSEWISDGNLKAENLASLKSLCDKLELKPSGFVVTPEALIHWLKDKDGAPVSSILVGIEEEELEVILTRAGKIVNAQTVSRSISLPDDITEGLTRFTTEAKEPLPPRIILFNRHRSSLEEATQNLLIFEWPKDFFLHAPRVEYLSPEDQILAVSSSAAGELMGVVPVPEPAGGEASVGKKAEEESVEHRAERVEKEGDEEPAAVEQETIPEAESLTSEEPLDVVQTPVMGTEISNVDLPAQAGTPHGEPEYQEEEIKPGFFYKVLRFFAPLTAFRPKIPRVPVGGGRSKALLIAVAALAILIGFFWWFLPQAVVSVYITPKRIEEKITLSVDPTGKDAQDIVPGRVITGQVSGEKTKTATGTRTVGDKSRGEVTIYNNTSQAKSFSGGVLLVNGTGLKFTLDAPVTVASESGAPTYIPGQTKAAVTAADIGAEYNLEAGNVFQIANFTTSSFSGKNDFALGGGSSRETSSVSRDDQKKLEEELLAELEGQVKNQISGQIGDSEKVIGESAKVDVTKKSFSAAVGDEAQTLKLNMTGEGRVVVVAKAKLNEKLLSALSSKVSQDFVLLPENVTVGFDQPEEEKTGILKLGANVVGNLLPKVDTRKLAKEISGKSPARVREKLAALPGFARTTIKLTLSPPFFSNLPQRAERIVIKILAEQ